MTFLPIVERELRVATRRRTTYWSRLMMALVAMLIGGSVLVVNLGGAPTMLGQFIFNGLAVLALVYCLVSGRRFTADCLSSEKREGTLGLLFLTDLNGYDVVLGKLVATSLNAFYGLLAIFPVLAIPLLLGGITNGEFWRLALVLVSTFLFSLAIGIYSSAVCYDARNAMAINFGLVFSFTALLPGCAAVISVLLGPFVAVLCFTSPVYCFVCGLASAYKVHPKDFWWSVAVIHSLTWFLLIRASRIAPRSWQDKPVAAPRTATARGQSLWHTWNYGASGGHAAFRKKMLDVNAFSWLAARARRKPVHVWVFLILIVGWWGFLHFLASDVVTDLLDIITALLLTITLKFWLALESGQRLAEDKSIGALELILSTPFKTEEIVRGQMLALRRQFLAPVLAIVALDFYLMKDARAHTLHYDPQTDYIWLAGIFMLGADLIALSWVGMAKSLTAKTHNQAIIATVFYVLLLPGIVFGVGTGVIGIWNSLTSPYAPFGRFPNVDIHYGWYFALGLAADIFFALRAREILLNKMRLLAAQRFASASAGDEINLPTPKRPYVLRRAIALAVVLVGVWIFWPKPPQRKLPPPVTVPVRLSQGPLRVFPGSLGALFILPDDSLWYCGQVGNLLPRTDVPVQIGTNHDWAQASISEMGLAGVRRDGTLWEQSQRANASGPMTQIDSGHDWVQTATAGLHSFALKRNGTLWGWGNNRLGQLGIGTTPAQTNLPVQIGTNNDWRQVCCNDYAALALRTNGTLWTWGPIFFGGTGNVLSRINFPAQVSRDTNWTGFDIVGKGSCVSNDRGELWEPSFAPPNATLGAFATCRLVLSNCQPDQVAFANCGHMELFEIHPDGRLWENDSSQPPGKGHQVGKRSDWRSVWSGGGTAYGVTADGTVWTWGTDLDRQMRIDFAARLEILRVRLMGLSGNARRVGGMMGAGTMPLQYQAEPRPLMKLIPAK